MLTDMYREDLHVEIAILVSLLLHAFAFGSWQYRAALMKLPGFSSLAKLMHVSYAPPKPAAPAVTTMTFVAVDEPKTKAEREKEQAAKHFMETDASQVTGEKPKNAKFYSDKSTVAANPNNPTGKQDNTPYLEGKETHVMNSADVPTPSGAATPAIQGGASAPPVPQAPQSKPTPQAPPQPKAASPPQEVPPVGVKIVEEQKMAMAPKPVVQPEVVTGSDVPVSPPSPANPAGAGAPAVASEPGVPGREIVARKAHLTVAGVTRFGVAAFGVDENPFGAYDKKIIKAVQSRWYALIDRFGMYERAGAVTVHFQLLDDGQVQDLKVSDNTAGEILSLFCEKAIIESGPFDPLPDNLRALVGKEPRDASFTFYY